MMRILYAFLPALCLLSACGASSEPAVPDYVTAEVETVTVNKRGLAPSGGNAVIQVRSNTYWVAVLPDGCDWLSLPVRAGYGDGTVEIVSAANSVDERRATVTLTTLGGASAAVNVVQESSSEPYVYFTSEMLDIADGETVPLGSVRVFGGTSFRLRLTASTTEPSFDREHFLIQVSRTGERWVNLPYVRSSAAAEETGEYTFSIKEGVETVFLRLVSRKGAYKAGLSLIEAEEGGERLVFYEDNIRYVYHPLLEEDFEWIEPGAGTVFTNTSAGSDGTNFNKQADLHGWTNSYTYVRPGFIKLGTANEAGWMQSPRIGLAAGETKDVLVEFDAAGYNNDNDLIEVTAVGGSLIGNEVSTTLNIASIRVWAHFEVRVSGAQSQTQIRIGSSRSTAEIKSSGEANRFFLDNVRVSWYEVINLNEQ